MNESMLGHNREIRVSVCMATYNGARYVKDQIGSILRELGPRDELVIVDDASSDETPDLIAKIEDPRIRLVRAAVNKGYVRTFEEAIGMSRGNFIFLSDQDDVWTAGRLSPMLKAMETHKVVASNFDILGGGPRPWIPKLRSADSGRHFANLFATLIGYRAYYGCAMALRRDALPLFTPIPPYVRESHDLWLAICGNIAGSIVHLDESTVNRRLHDSNQTPSGWRSASKILKARFMLLRLITVAFRRKKAKF